MPTPISVQTPNAQSIEGFCTPIVISSANQANANAVATLPAVAGRTLYLTGFEATATGATAGLAVNVTVTGINGGTLNYAFGAAVGATVTCSPLLINYNMAIPAADVNTAIVVTLPALGLGNTNAAVVAHGYYI